ncbi:hypothetical protein SMY71_000308 [Cronobacter sakazakii]|uniref:hypothetical protein n=1 Tax=Cronobacter sakazakii TaxID=28141 RepID=UPI001AE464AE|nr:hypothetical protein [Cronobacter sakazakii]EKK3979655.1 hypothetical protein [Cronobacter sakazakii]ELY4218655.1 hypothetical protein [Cronobacter sakazakii]
MKAQTNHFDKIFKEIPSVTMLLVVFYFFSYFFQVGLAFFWGYPSEYIEINLDVMLSTSAAFLMVALIASHLLDGLINGGRLPFITSIVLCCFFSLVISVLIFGYKSTFDMFRGIISYEHLFVFAFVACSFYAANGVRDFFSKPFSTTRISTTILTVISLCGCATLSGVMYSMMPWKGYLNGDGMVLVAKYSDALVFGQCHDKVKHYKIVSSNSDIKLKESSSKEMKKLKRCFIDNI